MLAQARGIYIYVKFGILIGTCTCIKGDDEEETKMLENRTAN